MSVSHELRRLRGLLLTGAAALLVLATALVWHDSRLPAVYSVHEMGYADFGGGPEFAHGGAVSPVATAQQRMSRHGGHAAAVAGRSRETTSVSVADLVADPTRRADVRMELVARAETTRLADGTRFEGYTVNGTTPGPSVEAVAGQLIEVVFRNENVADGATLHWHGIDLPNGVDGVAGVTQDAVSPGQRHVYRFVARDSGTYWYHSHQVSHEQVLRGLFGAVVIRPRVAVPGASPASAAVRDVTAVLHTYDGRRTINGRAGDVAVPVPAGATVRVRVVNTDNGPTPVWVTGAPWRVVAIDGRDLHRPGPITGQRLPLTAGARVDLELRLPSDGTGVRVQVPGGSIVLGPVGAASAPAPSAAPPATALDLLGYGDSAPLDFDPDRPDRRFDYVIGRRFGLLDGRPGMWWTINGHLYPDVPMFLVRRGDVVVMRLRNESGDVHPMHLHGHHAVVRSIDGRTSTGSPWFVDSLNIEHGQTVEISFVADNPGIWMDHCHNLPHAAEGLVAHLMYEGVRTPYRVGSQTANRPE